MKINKLNYENHVIDYIEGNLTGELKEAFDLFIVDHPEIYDEIKDFISAPILKEDKSIVFENKEALIMKTSSFNYLWLLIPFLLVAASIFFYGTKKEVSILPTTEIKKTPELAQSMQVKNEIKVIAPSKDNELKVKPLGRKSENIETSTSLKTTQQAIAIAPVINKKTVAKRVNEKFAKAEAKKVIIASTEKKEQTKAAIDREMIHGIASIKTERSNLTFDSESKSISMNFSNKKILEKRDSNWKDLKNAFATRAFKDVDLKESLSSESVNDFMKERKILQSFIPETFTKK